MIRRVLLVDDADDIRTIARLSLERVGGWSVTAAADGQAALDELADATAAAYDAVLLDVMMPGMDGPETLRRMRERGLADGVPVVFLTAKTQAAERERLLGLGAVGVIGKPFDPMTLADELAGVLRNR